MLVDTSRMSVMDISRFINQKRIQGLCNRDGLICVDDETDV